MESATDVESGIKELDPNEAEEATASVDVEYETEMPKLVVTSFITSVALMVITTTTEFEDAFSITGVDACMRSLLIWLEAPPIEVVLCVLEARLVESATGSFVLD